MNSELTKFRAIADQCKYTECGSRYNIHHLKCPNMYGVHYVTECSDIYYDDGHNKIKLNAEKLYFFPANTEFRLYYDIEAPENFYYIYWLTILARPGLCDCVLEFDPSELHSLSAIIPTFKALVNRDYIKDKAELAVIKNNFASLLLAVLDDILPFKQEDTEQIERVIFYINQNLSSDLSSDKLSEIAMLNRSYFFSAFCSSLKLTPGKYINEIRMMKAKEMLAQGSKISEIAQAVGYHDEKVFSRAFKNSTGTSPGKFRQQNTIGFPMV